MTVALREVQTAREGLALEAKLFADRDPGVIAWSARSKGLVCPVALSRKHGLDDAPDFEGWPIITRPTGGGTVPQGPGILNLAISYEAAPGMSIEDGYVLLTDILKDGLSDLGLDLGLGHTPQSFCDGDWNLTVRGKKLAGTAQRWKPCPGGCFRVLGHAALFVGGDVEGAAAVIGRLHARLGLARVVPTAHTTIVQALKGKPVDQASIAQRLTDASWSRLRPRPQTRTAA